MLQSSALKAPDQSLALSFLSQLVSCRPSYDALAQLSYFPYGLLHQLNLSAVHFLPGSRRRMESLTPYAMMKRTKWDGLSMAGTLPLTNTGALVVYFCWRFTKPKISASSTPQRRYIA
ncbi:MAG: hypothetical protein V7731_24200 [Amphritea sp.]